jgi:hypothetical protein
VDAWLGFTQVRKEHGVYARQVFMAYDHKHTDQAIL